MVLSPRRDRQGVASRERKAIKAANHIAFCQRTSIWEEKLCEPGEERGGRSNQLGLTEELEEKINAVQGEERRGTGIGMEIGEG